MTNGPEVEANRSEANKADFDMNNSDLGETAADLSKSDESNVEDLNTESAGESAENSKARHASGGEESSFNNTDTREEESEGNKSGAQGSNSDEFKDKYYYLAAEMQNMQRRFDKDKEHLLKFGSEKILKDILEVVDNFERTLSFIKNDTDEKVKNIVVGIEMITNQMVSTLEKHGLKKVEAMGEEFDPNFHEAISTEKSDDAKDDTVTQVHQNGYILNERLLRPAKVTIAKN